MAKILAGARSGLTNILRVSLPTLLVCALMMEVFTRLALPASDYPDVTFDPLLGRHFLPGQNGRYVKGMPTEIDAAYSINSSGWNSPRDYTATKGDGVFRIAVIGDSFIEALQVEVGRSYPYLIEERLNNMGPRKQVEAYSYGHSGANLAQYLNVLRHEVSPVRADLVIVNVVPNDFKESLESFSLNGFWSLRRRGETFEEIPPAPVGDLFVKRLARQSAFIRYLMLNLSIESRWRYLLGLLRTDDAGYTANIRRSDVAHLGGPAALRKLLEFLFQGMRGLASASGSKLVLVFDADRRTIYRGENPKDSVVHGMNETAMDVARNIGIATIDLSDAFLDDWQDSQRSFNWRDDGHWNDHGHQVVANTVTRWVVADENDLI